ncbi:MAG TPA: Crp/Fnr family transcriptional regulator [Azospirillaceae bacterium]|nr:Crp/Fnr family transcriptional regulator [Azospirillaceae bacterium]
MATSGPAGIPENLLLRTLPPADRDALLARLEPVELAFRQILHEAGAPITHVYFIEAGIVSHLPQLEEGQAVEVGLTGPEGLVGLDVALGGGTAVTRALVQVPGRALRMTAEALRAEMANGGPLAAAILLFVRSMYAQTAQVAACNARHGLIERMTRWLLMMHDRIRENRMPLTHDLISKMLGVRRSGVTLAIGALNKVGAVSQSRGTVTVLDRPGLEAAACGCYGVIRRATERLPGAS